MSVEVSRMATAFILGLFAGSLLTEAMVLVPFWKSMAPEAFFRLHHTMGPGLYRYFAPITILATLIPAVNAVNCLMQQADRSGLSVLVSVLMIGVLGIYFYYFKSANTGFAAEDPDVEGLQDELVRWGMWHWIRTVIVIAALILALFVLT